MSSNIENTKTLATREERLSIEVTTHCNSACSHCFVRAGISEHSSLPVDLVKEIIAEGYNTAYRHLHITGGEPLLWEGLHKILDYAFELGYETALLNTNGTLLSKNIIMQLASYDGLSISITLQGPEMPHNRIRGEGSYRKTIQGIGKVLDAGIDLSLFTIASKSSLPCLIQFADKTYKTFPSIKGLTFIQLIRVMEDVLDLSNDLLCPDDFVQLVRIVSFLNLCGLKIDVLNNPLACVVSKLLEIPWMARSPPLHRPGRIVILANREMTLSHSLRKGFGKYEPGIIEELLASHEYQNATEPDKTTCPRCGYHEFCTENGMVQPSEWFRDMRPEVPYCQRVLDRTSPRLSK